MQRIVVALGLASVLAASLAACAGGLPITVPPSVGRTRDAPPPTIDPYNSGSPNPRPH